MAQLLCRISYTIVQKQAGAELGQAQVKPEAEFEGEVKVLEFNY